MPGGGAVIREPSLEVIRLPIESMIALRSVSHAELFEYRSYLNEMAAAWAAPNISNLSPSTMTIS